MHVRILVLVSICMLTLALSLPPAEATTAAAVAANTQAAINRGDVPKWWTPELPDEVQRNVESKGKQLAERLELTDDAQAQDVAELIAGHFGRVWAWHQQVDEQLDDAWAAWDAARDTHNGKQKDELKALAIMTERIDPIYAEFQPQIQGFMTALQQEIGDEKTMALLDRITRSPGAKRTYDAYVAMVPEMTDEERAVLWQRMVQAREDSLAAWTDGRIVKIFKKYKIRNEFSIDYFGYGYRKRYEAWARGTR